MYNAFDLEMLHIYLRLIIIIRAPPTFEVKWALKIVCTCMRNDADRCLHNYI